ncbi:MAG: MaoC family dehydratase [Pseudomonadota bacterium]
MNATFKAAKTSAGNFFEDFYVGLQLPHATPRTVTAGDVAHYIALYGTRFAVHSSDEFARKSGHPAAPVDDLLVFHIVFGKSVPDVSVNAVANLGYANGVFGVPVYPGDTLTATSEVVGLRQNSNGKTGTVYVRTTGHNQRGEVVLVYTRWVMVARRDPRGAPPEPAIPSLREAPDLNGLVCYLRFAPGAFDCALSGSPYLFEDYAVGERIDHVDGMTVEQACHMSATRLYQNTAKVHFNELTERSGRFGQRLVYGGHVMSVARAASYNGLANALGIAAINGGTHAGPIVAGDTVHAWSEVLDSTAVAGRDDVGALRLRTVAVKGRSADGFPYRAPGGSYDPCVVLDFDYTVWMPTRAAAGIAAV